MKNKRKTTLFIVQSALIASIYVILTFLSNSLGLASGVIQLRLSEALTILPIYTSAAIPGLFVGCFLSNILTGCIFIDVIFGSVATLIGAIFTYWLRSKRVLAPIPPIISNTLIVPFVLSFAYKFEGSLLFFALTVGVGELLSCGALGLLLIKAIDKSGIYKIF